MNKSIEKIEIEFIDIKGIKRTVKSQINLLNGSFMWWISGFPKMYVGRGSLNQMIRETDRNCKITQRAVKNENDNNNAL